MGAGASAHGRRILMVDDDPIGLTALAERLTRSGYAVATANCGEDALRTAGEQKFDLALLDMCMPDMSGAELAGRLIKGFGCFSLILSGHGDADSVRDAVRDGALGYLLKPIDPFRLIPSIETAMARAREVSGLIRSHEGLTAAVRENRETSMATGILMERLRIDRNSAFQKLRDAARKQRRRVEHVAEEILGAVETVNGV